MKTIVTLVLAGALLLFALVPFSHAHTPFCSCYGNGDGSVTCEGGYSDGSNAAGAMMTVHDGTGKAIVQGKMDADGIFTFKKPDAAYSVTMDGGDMHVVTVSGDEIFE